MKYYYGLSLTPIGTWAGCKIITDTPDGKPKFVRLTKEYKQFAAANRNLAKMLGKPINPDQICPKYYD